ncbi:O-succinylbenzoate--CoA ligase [Striga asiatica]|uniref:O-succinylbenzoate--CoA ligase n=1 Tax=Striga asiatica TaxID=4170 RepID=A0A5A7PZU4_STRAF|nr:O-succinylbenzoate--CoA ligase [Striga asiatica]
MASEGSKSGNRSNWKTSAPKARPLTEVFLRFQLYHAPPPLLIIHTVAAVIRLNHIIIMIITIIADDMSRPFPAVVDTFPLHHRKPRIISGLAVVQKPVAAVQLLVSSGIHKEDLIGIGYSNSARAVDVIVDPRDKVPIGIKHATNPRGDILINFDHDEEDDPVDYNHAQQNAEDKCSKFLYSPAEPRSGNLCKTSGNARKVLGCLLEVGNKVVFRRYSRSHAEEELRTWIPAPMMIPIRKLGTTLAIAIMRLSTTVTLA